MKQQDQDTYGGLKVDETVQENPQTQQAASKHDILISDVAALTQIPLRAWVKWTTNGDVGALDPSLVTHRSIWGSGGAEKPTVARTAKGLWTVTYGTEFFLGYSENPSEDVEETVAFEEAIVVCSSPDPGDDFGHSRRLTVSGPIVTLVTKVAATAIIDDVGNSSAAFFDVSLFIY